MNNLQTLYNNMVAANVDSNVFAVNYNNHGFACILLIQDYGCTLYISTLGFSPETIAVDIPTDFSAPTRLDGDEYLIIARYLGFTGTTGNVFIPLRFFEELDAHIPPALNRPSTLQEKTRAIGRAANIAEEDKIYFCGWRRNGDSGNVRPRNYAKTRKLMGEAIANRMRAANISSRWTNIQGDENLALINEYLNLIDQD